MAEARVSLPVLERTLDERHGDKDERVHVLTGAVCNNNCIFCMEEDRDGRYEVNSRTTDESVKAILEKKRGAAEVCFTSGEPTTNPRFPFWVKMAKAAGVRRISVMTNGRALAYDRYTKGLVAAGLNRVYISIHGHTAKLHEGLTRTPGSFDQTLAGIDQVAALARYGVELHTSTVVTKRNLPHLGEIYRFLRAHGVQQVVFNVMQANGRANTHFDQIFPRYSEIAAVAAAFLEEQRRVEAQPQAFLLDIPLCTTRAIPDFHRGYVEAYVHYEPAGLKSALLDDAEVAARSTGDGLVPITRADLDGAERQKRAECARCKHEPVCEGVWSNYLARYGWDEMVPVPPDADAAAGSTGGPGH